MRIIKYIFCAILFVGASFAENITINWMDGNTTYAQTTCTVGGDLILPATPTRRGYTFAGWETKKVYSDGVELPVEYDRLEYIESTGTQYIDTGISGLDVGNWEIYAKWLIHRVKQDNYATVVSAYTSENANAYRIIMNETRYDSYYVSGNSKAGGGSVAVSLAPETIHTGYINNGYVIIDGTRYDTTTRGETISSTSTIRIIGTQTSAVRMRGRMYETWAKKDGELKYNYIPAKHKSDGIVGMLDLVTRQFFTNNGTGEFIPGPVINEL